MDVKLGLRYAPLLLAGLLVLVTRCHCEEEDLPEAALAPRNFNPHPYQTGYESRTRKFLPQTQTTAGLLLFPSPSTPLPLIFDRRQYISELEKPFRHNVDEHPYHLLAYRRKYQQQGRFQAEDDRINPVAHKALSKHAAKVLTLPSQLLKETYKERNYSDQKKDYSFSYHVSNQPTGDEFSHSQSQNAAQTKGEYKVKLPDGRIQIVSYTADDNGYNADVKYADDEEVKHAEKPKFVHIPHNNIKSNSGVNYGNNYDFVRGPPQYVQYVDDQRYNTFAVAKDRVQHVIHGNALEDVSPTVPSFGVAVPTVYNNVISTTSLPAYDAGYHTNGVLQQYLSRKPYFI